jgi:RND family efflux transporter MFP subunit
LLDLLRQLLISLVVVLAAAAAFVFLVPGSSQMLARYGINLPTAEAAPQAAAGNGPGAGQRPGGGGRGGFNREMVVVTAPVAMATINDNLEAIGDGSAARSVTVISPASGTLAALEVKPGDRIEAGAVLGKLDSAVEEIAYQKASLAFEDAEAALKRTTELAGANNATTVQVSTAQLAADTARLALQSAELELRKRTISSPIGGTVGLFQVSPGNTVTAQTVVTTIEDTSHIRVGFWVPERYATAIRPGMPITAEAVALPGATITGEVSAVDNKVDPDSRTLAVEAEIPNDAGALTAGMSFAVHLKFPGDRFPAVDPLSVVWSSEGAYVWRYADGKVEKVPAQIIQRNSDGVLVKADLAEGDEVVTQGIQQLSDGASVRLLDAVADDTMSGKPMDGDGTGKRPGTEGQGQT